MKKESTSILLIVLFNFIFSFCFSQKGSVIGQSKTIIEKGMAANGFKLTSDEKDKQQYLVDESENFWWIKVFFYDENNYCSAQSDMFRLAEKDVTKMENLMLDNLCGHWEKISSSKVICDRVTINRSTDCKDPSFCLIQIWWTKFPE